MAQFFSLEAAESKSHSQFAYLFASSTLSVGQHECLGARRSIALRPELVGTDYFFGYDQQ
jgi:hypothetical protein